MQTTLQNTCKFERYTISISVTCPHSHLSQMLHEDKTDVSNIVLHNQPSATYSCDCIQERETYRQREREQHSSEWTKHTYTIAHLFKSHYCMFWCDGTLYPSPRIPVLGAEAVASTWFLLPSLISNAVSPMGPHVHTQREVLLQSCCYK